MINRPSRRLVLIATAILGISAIAPGFPVFGNSASMPVLTFDVVSATSGPEPLLEILQDGTARARPLPGETKAAERQLTPAELQSLVDFMVDDIGFMSLSGQDITRQIETITANSLRIFSVADGGETRISLTLPDARNTVAFYGTSIAARTFPEIDDLQRLRRAELRLLEIVREVRGQ